MSQPRARILCLLALCLLPQSCARSAPEQTRPAASTSSAPAETRSQATQDSLDEPSLEAAPEAEATKPAAPASDADESFASPPSASPDKKAERARLDGNRAKATTTSPARPAAGAGALPAIEPVGAAESLERKALDRALDPAEAELPQLRAALLDFAMEHEALSTAGSCAEACRAYTSMSRAKEKICGLVAGSDPEARCAAATSRLESARRTLEGRCGSCP